MAEAVGLPPDEGVVGSGRLRPPAALLDGRSAASAASPSLSPLPPLPLPKRARAGAPSDSEVKPLPPPELYVTLLELELLAPLLLL